MDRAPQVRDGCVKSFHGCRIAKIAEAYGIAAERLASPVGLPDALRRAQAAKKPYLIEIAVD